MKILFTGQNSSQGLKESDATSIALIALERGDSLTVNLSENPDVVICADWKGIPRV